MSEADKGQARATGALVTFFADMQREMNARNRSPEYRAQFWKELQEQMTHMQGLEGMANV